MDLDPAVLIPAILFTVVAIYFASSFLTKKPENSSSSAGNKKPKVGYGDDTPPSRALRPRDEPSAPAVEDVGAAETLLVRCIDLVFVFPFIGKDLLRTNVLFFFCDFCSIKARMRKQFCEDMTS